MASKHQSTGMTGLYLVAAELSKRGFIVSPTSRSAQTADLLVTDATCKNIYAVQVKSNARSFSFWLVNKTTSQIISDHLIYALVNLRRAGPEFFLVPSKVLASKVKVTLPKETRKTTWYSVDQKAVSDFRDRWDVFASEAVEREEITD
jgi:hypothetical protein